jgi:hypothetical protein
MLFRYKSPTVEVSDETSNYLNHLVVETIMIAVALLFSGYALAYFAMMNTVGRNPL